MKNFEELGLSENILKAIGELGFETPMPIQAKAIPHILENKGDLVGLAQTGTGKTAAFGLPLIEQVDLKKNLPQSLILCPTRELCMQISEDMISFSKNFNGLNILPIFGGASIDKQITKLKKGVHIIVATPGRLKDLIERGKVNISKIDSVVLDEADEMLNMGFRDDINEILEETPVEKNVFLFSATMPKEVAAIAKNYMAAPVEISVGKKNTGAENVTHRCYMVHARDRYLALKRVADFNPNIYGIIFCRTRKETQEIADSLMRDGYNADALHGDLSQAQRDYVMNKFRNKTLQMLVATDVAARGLDVNDLTHVINYNLPDEIEIYTHRSGRTGRAGKSGISVVIAHLKEKHKVQQIEKKIGKKFEFNPVPGGKEICEKQLFHLVDKMERVKVDHDQIDRFLPEIYKKLEWLNREDLIKQFVSLEFNRFLDYYKNVPDLNLPDEKRKRSGSENFTRFFINVGKKDGVRPQDMIGIICDATGQKNIEIGEIDLVENFSFFEADSAFEQLILESLSGFKYKRRTVNVEVAEKKQINRKGRRGAGFGESTGRKSGGDSGYSKRGSSDRRRDRDSGFSKKGSSDKRKSRDAGYSDAPVKGKKKKKNATPEEVKQRNKKNEKSFSEFVEFKIKDKSRNKKK